MDIDVSYDTHNFIIMYKNNIYKCFVYSSIIYNIVMEVHMENLQSMFADSNEKQIATLGAGYLKNFLATGSLDKGFCAVSDKRVYFKGKCYYKSGKHYKSTKEERTVDLKDITGTGFSNTKRFGLFVASVIYSILAVLFDIYAIFELNRNLEYGYDSAVPDIILCIVLVLVPSLVLWILYFVLKFKVFEIAYAGGKIAFKASNYSEDEMQSFQKQLRRAKDNCISTASTSANTVSSMADELKKYKDLLDAGAISQEEYDSIKSKILSK